MHELYTTLIKIQPYAIAGAFAVIYIFEHIVPQRKDLVDYRHDFINVLIGIFNLVLAALGGYCLQRCLTYAGNSGFGILLYLPPWAQLGFGLLAADLFMYWWHRWNHQAPFLWRFHRFHHTDQKLNATSAVRFHSVELTISYLIKIPVFVLLGIGTPVVLVYSFIFLPVVILHHSNIRITAAADRLLRRFVVSPPMHRIHHSNKVQETDSNYGSVLPYWDMIFSSYIPYPEADVVFGVEKK